MLWNHKRVYSTRIRLWYSYLSLVFCDIFSLLLTIGLCIFTKNLLGNLFAPYLYWNVTPFLILFVFAYFVSGLYEIPTLSAAEELRLTTINTTLVYLAIATATFLSKEASLYSRSIFLVSWLISLVLVPINRFILRRFLAKTSWWGWPTVIIGLEEQVAEIENLLNNVPQIGLKPCTLINIDKEQPLQKNVNSDCYGILLSSKLSDQKTSQYIGHYEQIFSKLLIIPYFFKINNQWIIARDLRGILGLEVRQQLFNPFFQKSKRLVDIFCSLLGLVFLSPFFAVIALFIKWSSSGPVFFTQDRVGKNGKVFSVVKFRTMFVNAEKLLDELLEKDPALKDEYQKYRKLKKDPRVTNIGHFLRKYSIDELPQLWNVLKGEVSLVGPRAYVPEEISRMDERKNVILRITPGISGLWQVSGRNNLSFEQRIALDIYYVRNWSMWLDLYLLAKTVAVVVQGEGAY